jgi:ribosomal protein L7Ae-like RNA K-turn-binding protein
LLDLVDRLLARAALDALAIANKAGRVVAGFERVGSALKADRLAALIHATDASPDGVRKLAGAQTGAPVPLVRAFTASQLGLALGRPNVIHAALLGGREGDSFLARWRTLERYRANDDGDEPTRAGTETVQPDAASELGTE